MLRFFKKIPFPAEVLTNALDSGCNLSDFTKRHVFNFMERQWTSLSKEKQLYFMEHLYGFWETVDQYGSSESMNASFRKVCINAFGDNLPWPLVKMGKRPPLESAFAPRKKLLFDEPACTRTVFAIPGHTIQAVLKDLATVSIITDCVNESDKHPEKKYKVHVELTHKGGKVDRIPLKEFNLHSEAIEYVDKAKEAVISNTNQIQEIEKMTFIEVLYSDVPGSVHIEEEDLEEVPFVKFTGDYRLLIRRTYFLPATGADVIRGYTVYLRYPGGMELAVRSFNKDQRNNASTFLNMLYQYMLRITQEVRNKALKQSLDWKEDTKEAIMTGLQYLLSFYGYDTSTAPYALRIKQMEKNIDTLVPSACLNFLEERIRLLCTDVKGCLLDKPHKLITKPKLKEKIRTILAQSPKTGHGVGVLLELPGNNQIENMPEEKRNEFEQMSEFFRNNLSSEDWDNIFGVGERHRAAAQSEEE